MNRHKHGLPHREKYLLQVGNRQVEAENAAQYLVQWQGELFPIIGLLEEQVLGWVVPFQAQNYLTVV